MSEYEKQFEYLFDFKTDNGNSLNNLKNQLEENYLDSGLVYELKALLGNYLYETIDNAYSFMTGFTICKFLLTI